MERRGIFLSYSHADERLKDRLVTQLKVLEYAGLVDLWDDDRIRAGGEWRREIDEAMAGARLAVLLVTADFLSSPFILASEVPELLERHRAGGLRIYPVIAKPCAWTRVEWLAKMQVRPKGGRPVWGGSGKAAEKELAALAEEIGDVLTMEEPACPGQPPPAAEATAEAGIEAVGDRARELSSRGGQWEFARVDEVLRLAIAHGAPLYNGGDSSGCVRIYRHAAGLALRAVREAGVDNMLVEDEMNLQQRASGGRRRSYHVYMVSPLADSTPEMQMAHDVLYPALENLRWEDDWRGRLAHREPRGRAEEDRRAWQLRHAFDHIHLVSEALKSIDSVEAPPDGSAALRDVFVARVIEATNSHSMGIYQEGLRRGQNWIKGCAVVYLRGELRLSQHVPAADLAWVRSHMLERRQAERLSGDAEWLAPQARGSGNAYEVAWIIRHAFDLLLHRLSQDGRTGSDVPRGGM